MPNRRRTPALVRHRISCLPSSPWITSDCPEDATAALVHRLEIAFQNADAAEVRSLVERLTFPFLSEGE